MTEKKPLPNSLLEHIPWDENTNPIWPASSFFLSRNVAQNLFPSKLSESQSSQLLDKISLLLLQNTTLQSPQLVKAESLSALEKEFLYEHFLCRDSIQNTLKGQGFIFDSTSHFFALLNVKDHLQLQLVDCSGHWEKAWQKINDLESFLSSSLNFAFSSKFGYLTASPFECGTALVVMCYLHLPLLIQSGQLEEAMKTHKEESVTYSGLQGSDGELVGDFVVLQNNYTLGLSEEMILRDLHMTATKLILTETTLRQRSKEAKDVDIKDQVSRAVGLLMHSLQLQTKESLDALSKIKLGLDLGWISGITDGKINEIFFKCRRAHLGMKFTLSTTDSHAISKKRAEFIQEQLSSMKFHGEKKL